MTDSFYAESQSAPHNQQPELTHDEDAEPSSVGHPSDGCTKPEQDALREEDFWSCGAGFADATVSIAAPDRTLALLEKLGPSPFERGGFPVIGFLATTYDKVTRYALEGD